MKPEARLVDWAVVGVEPAINKAFAVVNLHAECHLGIPREPANFYGGGISIGHPPGATGLRLTMTAMRQLAEIYEGDVVRAIRRTKRGRNAGTEAVLDLEVMWDEGRAQFVFHFARMDWPSAYGFEDSYEVIGNVYENPELVEVR